MAAGDRRFLGRGWRFPPHFDRNSGEAEMVEAEQDIRESLFVLMSTIRGERVMLPDYGMGLQMRVFDGTDLGTLSKIRSQISDAILFYEPRIKVERIDIDTADYLEGRLMIKIDYSIPSINSRSNMVFPYYFVEGTNISAQARQSPGGS